MYFQSRRDLMFVELMNQFWGSTTRKTTDTDETAAAGSQLVISADRMNAFKTHLSTLIDRQSSVTTQEILTYMTEHDATFTDAEIQMALAKMQDDNQIMLAGEIVIRI